MSSPSTPSIVRTVVPVIVGAIASYLITLGVTLQEDVMAALSVIITAAATAIYYIVVRWLEQKFPKAGILLGWAAVPAGYIPPKERIDVVKSKTSDNEPAH